MTPIARYILTTSESNKEQLVHDLDTIDKLRYMAKIRMASYQQGVSNSYNKNVHKRQFQEGDIVLRKVFPNTVDVNDRKFVDTWEGPYLIDAIVGRGAYKLSTLDGSQVSRSWNAHHLKTYHM